MKKSQNLLAQKLSIQVEGPMLDVLIHCKSEAQTIKKLKELKNLVNPPREKVVSRMRIRWKMKSYTEYIEPKGKIPGKHHFQIIHNHPNHPLNLNP
jgi:hypothetical protein